MKRRRIVAPVLVPALLAVALAGCRTTLRGPAFAKAIDADLATAAARFVDGGLTGREYLDLVADRAGKARRLATDPAWRAAADSPGGDRDGDRVPDGLDACPSPPFAVTDERGCPPPPRPPDGCEPGDFRCGGPWAEDDRRTRDLFEAVTLMFNLACDDSPTPQTPEPLDWGRGRQRAAGTVGFNLAVTEVDNQLPGCELFYEVQFREVSPPPGEPARFIGVLFRAGEDLRPDDPRRVVFGLPLPPPEGMPKRAELIHLLGHPDPVRWRVRAVNGAQKSSGWSPMRLQGPASGGVEP